MAEPDSHPLLNIDGFILFESKFFSALFRKVDAGRNLDISHYRIRQRFGQALRIIYFNRNAYHSPLGNDFVTPVRLGVFTNLYCGGSRNDEIFNRIFGHRIRRIEIDERTAVYIDGSIRTIFQIQYPIASVIGTFRLERTAVNVDNSILIRIDKVELGLMIVIILVVREIASVDIHLRIAISIYSHTVTVFVKISPDSLNIAVTFDIQGRLPLHFKYGGISISWIGIRKRCRIDNIMAVQVDLNRFTALHD